MDLVSPDLLEIALKPPPGLSPVLLVFLCLLGLFLWLFGGQAHRFWLVLLTTLLTGVYGLYNGREYGMQPLVAGLLLAVAAGALALSLMRILLFVVVGLASWWLMRWAAPTWDEPLASFLAGGLLGVVLFRVWVTTLASLLGSLLMTYSGLCLLDRLGRLDVTAFARQNGPLLNWAVAVSTLIGILVQYLMLYRFSKKKEAPPKEEPEEEPRPPKKKPKPPKRLLPEWLTPWRKAA